jgi:hypothetical protein
MLLLLATLLMPRTEAANEKLHSATMADLVDGTTTGGLPELISWDEFTTFFRKGYTAAGARASGLSELERRRRVFEANLARIRTHNQEADAGLHTFRAGVNFFSDLSPEEFRAAYTSQPLGSTTTPSGGRSNVVTRVPPQQQLALESILRQAGAPPASVDWRAKGAVTPIKDQAACGACVSLNLIDFLPRCSRAHRVCSCVGCHVPVRWSPVISSC